MFPINLAVSKSLPGTWKPFPNRLQPLTADCVAYNRLRPRLQPLTATGPLTIRLRTFGPGAIGSHTHCVRKRMLRETSAFQRVFVAKRPLSASQFCTLVVTTITTRAQLSNGFFTTPTGDTGVAVHSKPVSNRAQSRPRKCLPQFSATWEHL